MDTDTQPDALFGADTYLTALENGVFTVDWWDTHNGPAAISTAPDGATDYDDWGILSSGTCVRQHLRAAAEHPVPHVLRDLDAEQDRRSPATRW